MKFFTAIISQPNCFDKKSIKTIEKIQDNIVDGANIAKVEVFIGVSDGLANKINDPTYTFIDWTQVGPADCVKWDYQKWSKWFEKQKEQYEDKDD